jgi:hypothetical protein
MENKLIMKWGPILDVYLLPYKLNDFDEELLEMLVEYFEKETSNQHDYINQNSQNKIIKVIEEFKNKLTTDFDVRINIKNTYFNSILNRIVYELENGDFVYSQSPIVMRNPTYQTKWKQIFNSIVEKS